MGYRAIVVGGLVLAVVACARTPEPPTLVEADQVEPLLYLATDLDGRRIALDGYIGLDNGEDGQAIAIGQVLTTRPGGSGRELIRLAAPEGGEAGQLNLPKLSSGPIPGIPNGPEIAVIDMAHATYQDATGAAHSLGQKVRVTGRLAYPDRTGEPDARAKTGRRLRPRLIDATLDVPPET